MKKCKGYNNIPKTNMKTGHFYWIKEKCNNYAMKGSDFCLLHDKKESHNNLIQLTKKSRS